MLQIVKIVKGLFILFVKDLYNYQLYFGLQVLANSLHGSVSVNAEMFLYCYFSEIN